MPLGPISWRLEASTFAKIATTLRHQNESDILFALI